MALTSLQPARKIKTDTLHSYAINIHIILDEMKCEIFYLCVVRLTVFGSLLNQFTEVCFVMWNRLYNVEVCTSEEDKWWTGEHGETRRNWNDLDSIKSTQTKTDSTHFLHAIQYQTQLFTSPTQENKLSVILRVTWLWPLIILSEKIEVRYFCRYYYLKISKN